MEMGHLAVECRGNSAKGSKALECSNKRSRPKHWTNSREAGKTLGVMCRTANNMSTELVGAVLQPRHFKAKSRLGLLVRKQTPLYQGWPSVAKKKADGQVKLMQPKPSLKRFEDISGVFSTKQVEAGMVEIKIAGAKTPSRYGPSVSLSYVWNWDKGKILSLQLRSNDGFHHHSLTV